MATIEHNGIIYEVTKDGFLICNGDGVAISKSWDENWVDYVKVTEGISQITYELQQAINTLQEYYKENEICPTPSTLSEISGVDLLKLYAIILPAKELGVVARMAGLPRSTGLGRNMYICH